MRSAIVSDIVCPWCIVGYRQSQQALDATGVETDISLQISAEWRQGVENFTSAIQQAQTE